LNDLKNNRLEHKINAERRVDYEVKDDQLVYRIVLNKLDEIVVNSNRDRFYVIYVEEGVQQVALFSVDAMKNSAKLMGIEVLIGEVSWSEDELDIIN